MPKLKKHILRLVLDILKSGSVWNAGQCGAKLSKAVQCYNSLKGKLRVKDRRRRRRRRTRRQN